jgi:hypothetical protein
MKTLASSFGRLPTRATANFTADESADRPGPRSLSNTGDYACGAEPHHQIVAVELHSLLEDVTAVSPVGGKTMKSEALAVQSILGVTEDRAKGRQLSGPSPSRYARSWSLFELLVLLMVIAGCGAGRFNPNNVTVTVSPAVATVAENGQVPLQVSVQGECAGCTPFYNWLISENDGADCTWVDTPPDGPCPGGTLQEPTSISGPTATYIAPSTTGTFHVIGQSLYYSNLSGPPTTTKQGTSVITVSP